MQYRHSKGEALTLEKFTPRLRPQLSRKRNGAIAIVTSYDWESDTWTDHSAENAAHKAWREAVAEIADQAKATLPDCAGRVDRAVAICLNHDVELLEDGKAKVASQSSGKVVYHVVNGACTCKDYEKAPSHWCKHRIAAGLYKRATALVQRQHQHRDQNQRWLRRQHRNQRLGYLPNMAL
jgi:hypothetical protein